MAVTPEDDFDDEMFGTATEDNDPLMPAPAIPPAAKTSSPVIDLDMPPWEMAKQKAAPKSRTTRGFNPDIETAIDDAAGTHGVDPGLMRTFARIESGGDPRKRTGSYKGLFQLSDDEYGRHGGTEDIFDPGSNARAAALKLKSEQAAFEKSYGRTPSASELYFIHQQGQGGADAHWRNPDAPAWENMYRTAEGRQKGPNWAKQAIWGNLPDSEKRRFGSVENLTSRDFTDFWDRRVRDLSGQNDPVQVAQAPRQTVVDIDVPPWELAKRKAAPAPAADVPPWEAAKKAAQPAGPDPLIAVRERKDAVEAEIRDIRQQMEADPANRNTYLPTLEDAGKRWKKIEEEEKIARQSSPDAAATRGWLKYIPSVAAQVLFRDWGSLTPGEAKAELRTRLEEAPSEIKKWEDSLKELADYKAGRLKDPERVRALAELEQHSTFLPKYAHLKGHSILEAQYKDYLAEEKLKYKALKDIEAGLKPGFTKTATRAGVENFATGVADVVASIPKFAGIASSYLGVGTPNPEESHLVQFGEWIQEKTKDLLPGDMAREQQQDFAQKLAQGAGSMVGFIGPGAAMRALGLAGKYGSLGTTLVSGGAAQGVEVFDEATDAIRQVKTIKDPETGKPIKFTPDEKDRMIASGWGFLLGLSEAAPIERALGRPSGRELRKIFAAGRVGATEEGAQEAFQTIGGNVVAKNYYDPTRDPFEGAGDAALIGTILGFKMGAGKATLDAWKYRNQEAVDPADQKKADAAFAEYLRGALGRGEITEGDIKGVRSEVQKTRPAFVPQFDTIVNEWKSGGRVELDAARTRIDTRSTPPPLPDEAAPEAPPMSMPDAPEATAPPPSPEEMSVLRRMGYTEVDIRDMEPEQRAAEMEDAKSRGIVPDVPSAEPIADIVAQARDLADPDNQRTGLYLSPDNVRQIQENPEFIDQIAEALRNKGEMVENVDGNGGVLLAKDAATAKAVRAAIESGQDIQQILGQVTGAGQGKPADATAVVQQVTPEGAVTRESAVTQDQVAPTLESFRMDGRDVRAVTPEEALGRREQGRATPPPIPGEQVGDGSRQAPVRVETPEDVARAEQRVVEPTDGQKEAGNYSKGHLKFQGLDITIENPKGSIRRGTSPDGTPWEVEMPATYGYVKRSVGRDGDQVDVYVGPNPKSDRVFVIDQVDPDTGKFDEHKGMLGYNTISGARFDYEQAFSDGRAAERLGGITEMTVAKFKDWLAKGKRTRPLSKLEEKPDAVAEQPTETAAEQADNLPDNLTDAERETLVKAWRYVNAIEQARAQGRDIQQQRLDIANELDADLASYGIEFDSFPDEQSLREYLGGSRGTDQAGNAVTEAPQAAEAEAPVAEGSGRPGSPPAEVVQREQADRGREGDGAGQRNAQVERPKRYEGDNLTDDDIDTIVDQWKYVREVANRPKPESLAAFVIARGGIKDDAREVRHIAGAAKERPGLINKDGWNLDDIALSAWESGFMGDMAERPTIADFLDRLQDDLHTGTVVRLNDEPLLDDIRIANEIARELADYGVTTNRFRSEATLREYFGQERPAVAGKAARDEEAEPAAEERTGQARPDQDEVILPPDEAPETGPSDSGITTEKSGQTSLVPEATTKEKIAAEAKKKGDRGKATADLDAGELFNPDAGKQTDLVDMAKAAKADPYTTGKDTARDHVLTNGRKTGTEYGMVVMADGSTKPVTPSERNSKSYLEVSAKTAPDLYDGPAKSADLHHNHPKSSSFSRADYTEAAVRPALRRTWVHGHDGSEYWASFKTNDPVILGKAYDIAMAVTERLTEKGYDLPRYRTHMIATMMRDGGVIEYGATLTPARADERIATLREKFGEDAIAKAVEGIRNLLGEQDVYDRRPGSARSDRDVGSAPARVDEARPESRGSEAVGERGQAQDRGDEGGQVDPLVAIGDKILEDGFKTIVDARKFARDLGIEGDNKAIDEIIETAVVGTASRLAQNPATPPNSVYRMLVNLYNNQPNLASRTGTSVANQAYSTPVPLAYLASRLAGVASSDSVYEPTAGNGALLLEVVAKGKAVVNELDPRRAASLRAQGFTVTENDGALPPKVKDIDSVIMNPPFGAVKAGGKSTVFKASDWSTTQIDHAVALNGLEAMAEDGKAVLILGGTKSEDVKERRKDYRGKAKREFYYRLYNQYNVVDHFTVSGDLYSKQGASWPVDVIVIDGRGKSERELPAANPPAILKSWDQLAEKLPDAAGREELASRPVDKPSRGTPERGTETARDDAGAQPATDRGGSEPAQPRPEGKPGAVRADRDPGQSADVGSRERPDAAQPRGDRDGGRTGDAADPKPIRPRVKRERKEGASQAPYEPVSNVNALDTLIPTTMADPARRAMEKVAERHGSVDDLVADRLGYDKADLGNYFSAEQVDAIASAIDNVEKGSALIVGDQTGIGKGRSQPFDAKLLTPAGWVDMGAIRVGDHVCSVAGTATKVVAIFPQGEIDVYRIEFSDGSSTEASADHLWATKTRNQRHYAKTNAGSIYSQYKIRTTIELADPTVLKQIHSIPLVDPIQFHERDLPIDPYLVGACLGDGCLREGAVQIVIADEEMHDLVTAALPAGVMLRKVPSRDYHYDVTKVSGRAKSNGSQKNPALEGLRSLGLRRIGSINKYVPNAIKFNSIGARLAVLQGLMDTDGECGKDGASVFNSTSSLLADDVVFIVRSLGGTATRSIKKTTHNPCHRVYVRLPAGINPFRLSKKADRVRSEWVKYPPTRYVKSVTLVGKKHCQCISIDHPSRLYVTDDFIVTHNTAAGMLRYAMQKGMVPVFVTEKPDLYGDMFRDLRDIGVPEMLGRDVRMFITNAGETVALDEEAVDWKNEYEVAKANGEPLPKRRGQFLVGGTAAKVANGMARIANGEDVADVVFTTYDQMNTVKGQTTARRQFLAQVAPGAMMVFDESHNAGGAAKTGWEKKDATPNRADFARELAAKAKGVMFSSATYAKRPDVMDLYARTDMGKAVDDAKELPELIQRGGVPMQQIVASMLSESGQYMRRERSFDGVEYALEPVPVDHKAYKQFSASMQAIFRFDLAVEEFRKEWGNDALDSRGMAKAKDSGVGGGSANSTSFGALMHNITNQMLLAIKAEQTAQRAIKAHKAGEKPVIALANTNESFIKDFAENEGIEIGQTLDLDFSAVLDRYLKRTLRVTLTHPDGKKKEHLQIPLDDLPTSLRQEFRAAQNLVREGDYQSLPISPIDWIRYRLGEAGMSVKEVTGRQTMIDYNQPAPKYIQRPKAEQGASGKRGSIAYFNSGRLDALILNRSGSTGVSMHASEKFKDRRRRRMILAQAEGNIDTHLQMLGRVHRTGQVIPPAYSQIAAEIPAEARPTAVLMKKMASLNANTTGARSSAFTVESVDFINEVGDKVVADLLIEDSDLNDMLGSPLMFDEKGAPKTEDIARKATGRLVLLDPDVQARFLDQVQKAYQAEVEQLDALGENPLEAKTVDIQAKTLDTTELKPKQGDSPFLDAVRIEKVSAKAQGRAMPPTEVASKVAEAIKGTKPDAAIPAALASLETQGRMWAEKERGRVTGLMREQIRTEVAETGPDAKDSTRRRLEAQLERWNATMGIAYPGARVVLGMPAGDLNGIVMSVERTGKAKQMTALGSWTVKIAVPDSMRVLEFPMSKLFPPSAPKSEDEKGATIARAGIAHGDLVDQFEAARKEGRETRYVVTGNILGGYDQTRGRGRIVNFTTDDGKIRPGILMGREFEVDKFMDNRRVRFQTGAQIATFLDRVPLTEVTSKAGEITLAVYRGEYRIEMAGSRQKAGQFFTDRDVLKALAPKDFAKRGNKMIVDGLSRAQFVRAVDKLKAIGGTFETNNNQDEAQEIIAGGMREESDQEDFPRVNKDGYVLALPYEKEWGNPRFIKADRERAIARLREIQSINADEAPWADLVQAKRDIDQIVTNLFYYSPERAAIWDASDIKSSSDIWLYLHEMENPEAFARDQAAQSLRGSLFSDKNAPADLAEFADEGGQAVDSLLDSKRKGLRDLLKYDDETDPVKPKKEKPPGALGDKMPSGFYFKAARKIDEARETLFQMSGQSVINWLMKEGVSRAEINHFRLWDKFGGTAKFTREEFKQAIAERMFDFRRKMSWLNPERSKRDYELGGTRAFTGPRVPGQGIYFERPIAFPKKLAGGAQFPPGQFESPHWYDVLQNAWASWRGSVRDVPGYGKMLVGEEGQSDYMQGASTGRRPKITEAEWNKHKDDAKTYDKVMSKAYDYVRDATLLIEPHADLIGFLKALAPSHSGVESDFETWLGKLNDLRDRVKPKLNPDGSVPGGLDYRYITKTLRTIDSLEQLRRENERFFAPGGHDTFSVDLTKRTPESPIDENYVRVMARDLLLLAAEKNVDSISVSTSSTTGRIQNNPRAAHFYDQQMKPALERELRRLTGQWDLSLQKVALPKAMGSPKSERPYTVWAAKLEPKTLEKIKQEGVSVFSVTEAPRPKISHYDYVKGRLLLRQPVDLTPQAEQVLSVMRQTPSSLPGMISEAVVTRITPIRGTKKFAVTARDLNGEEHTFDDTYERFIKTQGQYLLANGRPVVVLSALDFGGDLVQTVRTVRAHEAVHALRFNGFLPGGNRDTGTAWGRLVGHADLLGVLHMSRADLYKRMSDPRQHTASKEVSTFEVYTTVYGNFDRATALELYHQEAVAHMMEVYVAGGWTDQEIAPVKSILDDILSGKTAQWTDVSEMPLSAGMLRSIRDQDVSIMDRVRAIYLQLRYRDEAVLPGNVPGVLNARGAVPVSDIEPIDLTDFKVDGTRQKAGAVSESAGKLRRDVLQQIRALRDAKGQLDKEPSSPETRRLAEQINGHMKRSRDALSALDDIIANEAELVELSIDVAAGNVANDAARDRYSETVARQKKSLFNVIDGGRSDDGSDIIRSIRDVDAPIEIGGDGVLSLQDAITGQSMRRDLDSLGFYSKALEAARGLKQEKGTPEQMLAQLKKAGVKDSEIEATGLADLFREKSGSTTALESDAITLPPKREAPIVQYRRDAAAIEATLPPIPEGHTRLWRGNREGEVGVNPSFTNDLAGIALPFRNFYGGGPLTYVDISTQELAKYEAKAGAAPGAEFMLPAEIARRATPVSIPQQQGDRTASPPRRARLNQITKADIVKHLEENRVGLREVVRTPEGYDDIRAIYGRNRDIQQQAIADARNDPALSRVAREPDETQFLMALGRIATGGPPSRLMDIRGTRRAEYDAARRHVAAIRASREVAQTQTGELGRAQERTTKWEQHSLDPSNPTYRETVIHLPMADDASAARERLAAIDAEMRSATTDDQRDALRMERNALMAKGSEADRADFRSGHFPEPNIIGHMMTSMVKHEGKDVFLIDQIQDDWSEEIVKRTRTAVAQKLFGKDFKVLSGDDRKAVSAEISAMAKRGEKPAGVRDEAKIAELRQQEIKLTNAYVEKAEKKWPGRDLRYIPESEIASSGIDVADLRRVRAELRTAEASSPGHPLVNTTDQWTQTTLRRAIRQAVEAGAEYIAIPHGDTVLTYNPGDRKGMAEFYDKIVPKNLRNLLTKIDPSVKPQQVDVLETPGEGLTNRGDLTPELSDDMEGEFNLGFTLFPLTDKIRQSVMEDGQPMFSAIPTFGINSTPADKANSEIAKALAAVANDEVNAQTRSRSMLVSGFVNDWVIPSDGSSVTATTLYEAYSEWVEALGLEPVPLPMFNIALGDIGLAKQKIAGRVRYIGVSVLPAAERPPPKLPAIDTTPSVSVSQANAQAIHEATNNGRSVLSAIRGLISRLVSMVHTKRDPAAIERLVQARALERAVANENDPNGKVIKNVISMFSLAPSARTAAPADTRNIARDITEAISIITRITGQDAVQVEFRDQISGLEANPAQFAASRAAGFDTRTAGGLYKRPSLDAKALIALATNDPAYDLRTTAGHEAYHHVEEVLANPAEKRLLTSDSEMRRMRALASDELQLSPSDPRLYRMQEKEIRAIAFQRYRRMREEGFADASRLHIGVRRLFDRIVQIFQGVRNVLKGYGYDSYEAIFERARTGQMADPVGRRASDRPVRTLRNLIDPQMRPEGYVEREPFDLKDVRLVGRSMASVPLSDIQTIQKSVSVKAVRSKLGLPESDDGRPVSVFKYGDTYYVNDGNHRIEAMRARGARSIRAEVIEIAPKDGDAQVLADRGSADVSTQPVGAQETTAGAASEEVSASFGGTLPRGISFERNPSDSGGTYYDLYARNWYGAKGRIGHATVRDLGDRVQVGYIGLEPEYQRKGIATAIYGQIERDFGKPLVPDTNLSDLSYSFWMKHRPDAVEGKYEKSEKSGEWLLKDEGGGQLLEQLATIEEAAPQEGFSDSDVQASLIPAVAKVYTARWLRRLQPHTDRVRVYLQDKVLPVRRQEEAIEAASGIKLPEHLSVYTAEAIYHGRAGERLTDLQEQHVEPLIQHVRKSNISFDELGDYLYARHAIERNDAIRQIDPTNDAGSGMTDAEAQGIVGMIEQGSRAQAFKTAAGMIDAMVKDARDTLYRAGNLTKEQYDNWTTKYKSYVPLRGFEGEVEEFGIPRVGRGMDIRGPESMQALGRRSKADNPAAYVIQQSVQAIIRSEKNRVDKTLYRLIQAHPDPDVWRVFKGEAKRRINPATGLVEMYWVPPAFAARNKDNVFGVKIAGKQHYMEILHEPLARSLRTAQPGLMGTSIGRAFYSLSRFYAQLVTSFNPEFVISNYLRDIQTALMNVGDVANKPADTRKKIIAEALSLKSIRGVMAALQSHEGRTIFGGQRAADENMLGMKRSKEAQDYAKWFEEYRLAGGKISFIEMNDIDRIKKRVEHSIKEGKTMRAFRNVFDLIDNANSAVENGVRLSAYIALRKNGVSQDKAAFAARELTVNFNRKGELGPGINAFYLFFNASVQGTTRLAQALTRSPAVRKGAATIVLAGVLIDLLNYAISGKDDDDENAYEKIDEWKKEKNMIVMLPGRKDYVQIPMPYGYNVLYLAGQKMAALSRTAAGHGKEKPGKAIAGLLGAMVESFSPMGAAPSWLQMASPTLLDPFTQIAENKSWFGGKIAPEKLPNQKHKPDSEMFYSTAPGWAIDLARALNKMTGGSKVEPGYVDVSPESIEHMADFLLGGVGKFIGNIWNTGQRAYNDQEWIPEKTPFLRRVYGKATTESRRRDFYDKWNEVDAAHWKFEDLRKARDFDGMKVVREKNPAELAAYEAMRNTQRQISALRKQADIINLDRTINAVEKEKRLKTLTDRENEIILRALKNYNRLKKDLTPKD